MLSTLRLKTELAVTASHPGEPSFTIYGSEGQYPGLQDFPLYNTLLTPDTLSQLGELQGLYVPPHVTFEAWSQGGSYVSLPGPILVDPEKHLLFWHNFDQSECLTGDNEVVGECGPLLVVGPPSLPISSNPKLDATLA